MSARQDHTPEERPRARGPGVFARKDSRPPGIARRMCVPGCCGADRQSRKTICRMVGAWLSVFLTTLCHSTRWIVWWSSWLMRPLSYASALRRIVREFQLFAFGRSASRPLHSEGRTPAGGWSLRGTGGPTPPNEPPRPPLLGITRVSLTRIEVWGRGQCSAWWRGQCPDCLTVYWCDDRGEETWPPSG